MIWGYAALTAGVLAFAGALLSMLSYGGERYSLMKTALVGGIVSFVLMVPINAVFFAWFPPVFAGAGWVGWGVSNLMILLVVFGACNAYEAEHVGSSKFAVNATAPVSLVVILVVTVGMLWFWNNWYTGQDTAKFLANEQLNVTMIDEKEEVKNYPPTDEQRMVVVGEQNARLTAGSAMGTQNIGTRFNLGKGELQSIDGHLYYVFNLTFRSLTAANDAGRTVPGYIQVDAEDPNLPAQLKLDYTIKYWEGGPHETSLDRHVYAAFPAHFVDDLSLEVDDSGRPFYTASLNKPVARWFQSAPEKFITVDAQTGEIKQYPLDQVPSWVDRVYSDQTAEELLNWWGQYAQADYDYWIEAPSNRYKVSGQLNLVYTDEGPAWQALMSSVNNDVAVQYVALMSTRTNDVRMYKAPASLLVENRVVDAFQQSSNNLKRLDPTGLVLHKVFGKLVWVGSMVADGRGGLEEGGYPTSESFAGIGTLDATNADSAKVIIGRDKGDTFGQLSTQIATGSNNASPEANANIKTIEAIIASVSPPVVFNNNTYIIMTMEGDADHLYRGQVTEAANSLAMTVAKPGERVIITYLDSGGPIRNIASYKSTVLAGVN